MTIRNIDTHRFVKEFIAASKGADHVEKQAEIIADTIAQSQNVAFDNLATKQDLQSVQKDVEIINKDIKALETNLKREFNLKIDAVELKIDAVENKIIVKLGIIMAGLITVATTILGFMISLHH